MNTRTLSTIAIVGFLVFGAVAALLRYNALRAEQIAREDSLWQLTYKLQFQALLAEGEEAHIRIALPLETRHCRWINRDENAWTVLDPSLRSRVLTLIPTGNRVLELTTRQSKPAPYEVVGRFVLRVSPRPIGGRQPTLENLTLEARQRFMRHEPGVIPTQSQEVKDAAQLVPDEAQSEAERLHWVFTYCADIDSGTAQEPAGDEVGGALTSGRGSPIARARTMVALCRVLGIPARLVSGFKIQQAAGVRPHVWVEVFQNQSWVPFDPTDGWSQVLPMNYLPVRRDADQIYDVLSGVDTTSVTYAYSIKRLPPDPIILRATTPHLTQVFDLTRLPVPMHRVMQILLLLPFAALITAIIRNVVGLQTFGTFAPALLAMSFIYADWETGLAILLIVATVGLFGRLYLERLRLLMVPRLSIILTVVILCVVFSVSGFDFLGVTPSADAVLLPMVILTILIERFQVTVEEDGLIFALQLVAGTLVVAALSYLMLRWDEVGRLVLRFPEIHFFTIAAFIMLGRYAGYRLTELWRFRDLVEPSEPAR
jgi:transglutaminase-like putative cysteine protease